MTASTRKLTGLKYAATVLGAFGILAMAPATAFAVDNDPTPGGGGCHYTDADGYDIPIDEGQDVFVDGKIVSCRGGTIVVTTAPQHAGTGSVGGVGGAGPVGGKGGVGRAPVIDRKLPVLVAQP
jgi:hypothetical protein